MWLFPPQYFASRCYVTSRSWQYCTVYLKEDIVLKRLRIACILKQRNRRLDASHHAPFVGMFLIYMDISPWQVSLISSKWFRIRLMHVNRVPNRHFTNGPYGFPGRFPSFVFIVKLSWIKIFIYLVGPRFINTQIKNVISLACYKR